MKFWKFGKYLYLPKRRKTMKLTADASLYAFSAHCKIRQLLYSADCSCWSPQRQAIAMLSSLPQMYLERTNPRPHPMRCLKLSPGPSTPVRPPACGWNCFDLIFNSNPCLLKNKGRKYAVEISRCAILSKDNVTPGFLLDKQSMHGAAK